MLVDSKGKQINPSLNQPTDPVFRFSSSNEYEAMRDFLLGRALDWIKSHFEPLWGERTGRRESSWDGLGRNTSPGNS